jgi:hypothetical protein
MEQTKNTWRTDHVWSNIAYIIVGLLFLIQGATMPAIGLIGLGVSSYMAHLKGTSFWWLMDWLWMYLAFSYITFYHNPTIGSTMALVALIFILNHMPQFWRVGLFYVACTATAWFYGAPVLVSMAFFGLGFLIRQWGEPKASDLHHLTHSIWHALTSIGLYFLIP